MLKSTSEKIIVDGDVRALSEKYPGVQQRVIARLYGQYFRKFANNAKITTFIPIIVKKAVKERIEAHLKKKADRQISKEGIMVANAEAAKKKEAGAGAIRNFFSKLFCGKDDGTGVSGTALDSA